MPDQRHHPTRWSLLLMVLCFVLGAFHAVAQTNSCRQAFTLGPDQILCEPQMQSLVQVQCDWDVLDLGWDVSTVPVYLDSATWSVTPMNVETLSAQAQILSPNMIQNGDFNGGNSGFTSTMLYSPFTLIIPGSYAIVNNPAAIHPDFKQCQDHTTGSGNMLACNGSILPNRDIWCQNVTVEPGGSYDLSFWSSALTENESPELVFRIDGQNYGTPNILGPVTCDWQETTQTWVAGTQTSVQVCIRNLNGANSGNDFAIDDIVMRERCWISDTVTVRHVPRQTTTLDTLLCQGDSFTVGGNTIVNTGPDTIVVSDVWGCDSTIWVDAYFWDPNIIFQDPDTLNCLNDQVTLAATVPPGPGNLTLSWTDPGGNLIPGVTDPNVQVDQPGIYTLTASLSASNGGCVIEKMIAVAENQNVPVADAGPDGALTCLTDSVLVGSLTLPALFQAEWISLNNPAWGTQQGPQLMIGDPGIYQLLVTDPLTGCSALDTVEITDQKQTLGGLIVDIQAPVCQGGNGQILFMGLEVGDAPFDLMLESSGGLLTGGPLFAGLESGDFLLQVTDANGCSWDTLLTVPETVLPTFSLPQGLTATAGEEIVVQPILDFSSALVTSYSWSVPSLILDCADCPLVTVNGIGDGILTLCLELGPDCEICRQTYVNFEDTWYSYNPTAFSPNEDGINDFFKPIVNPAVVQRVEELAVFDRWGNQFYQWIFDPASSLSAGWDGWIGDQLAPSGVYVYSMQVLLITGDVRQIKGEVQLFR